MRSHYCGHVDQALIGQEISVCGWVHRRRDHGGVIFIDLRDREGILQVVFDPDRAEIFAEAERIRSEFVLSVRGLVRERPEGTINENMRTGHIEVLGEVPDIRPHALVAAVAILPIRCGGGIKNKLLELVVDRGVLANQYKRRRENE